MKDKTDSFVKLLIDADVATKSEFMRQQREEWTVEQAQRLTAKAEKEEQPKR